MKVHFLEIALFVLSWHEHLHGILHKVKDLNACKALDFAK